MRRRWENKTQAIFEEILDERDHNTNSVGSDDEDNGIYKNNNDSKDKKLDAETAKDKEILRLAFFGVDHVELGDIEDTQNAESVEGIR